MEVNVASFVDEEIQSSMEVKKKLFADKAVMETIAAASNAIIKAYQNGNKTILAGNGGSAADAQHIAGEFVSRFYYDRPALPSISLSTDPSIVTAIGNDYGYEKIFVRQVEAHGKPGDVFIGISTSGKSPNVMAAILRAKELGMVTIALTSERGIEMAKLCDHGIMVPSSITPKIQECHITIGHAICAVVERAIFPK